MRRHLVGTGWKMNNCAAETVRYAAALRPVLRDMPTEDLDLFVLPPFTSLHAAASAFSGMPVAIGGQNMHWATSGAWTGEISAAMLVEAGCRYVELAHSERLQYFGETYELVARKVGAAVETGLTPIICLGETAEDKRAGRADAVLRHQVATALAEQPPDVVPGTILAYEPRWAIGASEAASPDYVAERHGAIRTVIGEIWGGAAAAATRIIYGGSVTPENAGPLVGLDDVDGLFAGRSAWVPEGFVRLVAATIGSVAQKKSRLRCEPGAQMHS